MSLSYSTLTIPDSERWANCTFGHFNFNMFKGTRGITSGLMSNNKLCIHLLQPLQLLKLTLWLFFFRQMTTPSWDFIRASSWRTLMKHGCAPMTCSAWRYTTLVKRTRTWQEACGGKVEDGVPTPVRPKPYFDLPVIHHSEKKKTAPDCSHRKKHAGTCLFATDMRCVPLLKAHQSIEVTLALCLPAWNCGA